MPASHQNKKQVFVQNMSILTFRNNNKIVTRSWVIEKRGQNSHFLEQLLVLHTAICQLKFEHHRDSQKILREMIMC